MKSRQPHPAIAVFTERTAEQILAAGGSGAWVLDPKKAKGVSYLVCCQRHGKENLDAGPAHGAAFLVGEIKSLIPVTGSSNDRGQRRYHMALSKYARIDRPKTWEGWRNPVRYTSLEELGIDIGKLKFSHVPEPKDRSVESLRAEIPRKSGTSKLTIEDAKFALAESLGLKPENIEIIIRA